MKNLMRILVAVFAGIIFVSFVLPAHAETIWQKRQKVLQGEAQTEKQEPKEAPVAATEEPALPEPEETYAPEEEITDEAIAPETPLTPIITTDPYAITIPDQYGTIVESSKGTNDKLIVYIQDVHSNYEAQKNSAGILESLINNYGTELIFLEGRVTNADFAYVRERAPVAERAEKADMLLKNGDINGVDYVNIASDYPMGIQGIEDRALYDANRNALWEIDKFKDIASEYVNKLIAVSDQVKSKVYNSDLMEFDKKRKDYDGEVIDLVEYYTYLYKKAEAKGANVAQFANFTTLVKANDLEKKVNMANIISGKATDEEKAQYKEYTDLLKNLNIQKLFKEELLLENTLKDSLAENNDQKELLKISKALGIMKNLLIIKVVPEEYDYFTENKDYFDPQTWTRFLQEKADVNGITVDMPQNQYVISDNLDKIEHFYGLAFDRDDVFMHKIDERMNKDNAKVAALVAGGFHTPKLTKLLADNGYSYVVISPRVTTPTNDESYRSALKREWLPDIQ